MKNPHESREHPFKENLISALELPPDMGLKVPVITVCGRRQITVENYRTILSYKKEEIRIRTRDGSLQITGSNLVISNYTPEEMTVAGRIKNIDFEPRG